MITLHSHSGQFCKHAKGQLEDVVIEAVRQGFRVFGLSEHIPRYRKEELYSEELDAPIEDLAQAFESYIVEAKRLKKKYQGQIELLIGLETEYITPQTLDDIQALLDRHSGTIQYLVGSLHHVNTVPIDFDRATFDRAVASFPESSGSQGLTQLEQLFVAYFDAQYELMQRFKPEVIGHFDLCRLYVPEASFANPVVWSKVERNVRFGISYGALFEINAAAFRKGWKTAYPGVDVLSLIQSLDGRLTLCDDSHGPHAVGLHYKEAHLYLVEQKVQCLWYLTTTTKKDDGDDGPHRHIVPASSSEAAQIPHHDDDKEGHAGDGLSCEHRSRTTTVAKKWEGDWSKDAFWVNRN